MEEEGEAEAPTAPEAEAAEAAPPVAPEPQEEPPPAAAKAATTSPPPAGEEAAAAATEAPGDEGTAEAVGGAQAEVEEKPEVAPEEPPTEEEPPPPSEEAAPGEEGPAEEEEEEGHGVGEEASAASAGAPPSEVSLEAPELPTSASFAEGELSEPPPLQVSVDLERRISVSLWELERLSGAVLEQGSPSGSEDSDAAGGESEEQLEQRLAEERRRREELTEQYRQLQSERRRLRQYNTTLQGKLGELLNKGKAKEPPRAELEQHISDREQRYNRYLAMLEELRNQQAAEMAWYQKQIDALHGSCNEKLGKVNAEWKAYQAVKKEVAVFTMGRRLGGKHAAIKEVDQIQAREQGKENEMTEVRLEYIKLKHRIQKLEASLKAQEELAEGLHLIDFEQLKIENQTYNEKIEERNEELLKLRRKITNTVQIISQVKEKLQFVEAENLGQKAQLMAVEALVAQQREILTKTKQARDKLRMDNQKLQQKCGLLGHTLLLRDFENKVSAVEALKEKLDILKRRHAVLTLTCKGVKKKLQGVTSFLPL